MWTTLTVSAAMTIGNLAGNGGAAANQPPPTRMALPAELTFTPAELEVVGEGEAFRVRLAERSKPGAEVYRLDKLSAARDARPAQQADGRKWVTLTFDDGPSAEWTPALLDVLKAEGVKAAFFCVGARATDRPDLVRRAAAEGHTIGNHTWSHTDIRRVPVAMAVEEFERGREAINAALRGDEVGKPHANPSAQGVRLFRAPYDADPEPKTIEQLRPLVEIGKDGTVIVGAGVDSHDYDRPGVEQILNNVLGPVRRGEARIILFHDAGGDRSQTVETVKRLIPLLRSEGFTFVGLGEMMGE
jgi:peptidoglycan/xylan/chitin deacetylase (PgdA/CDA1 family)